MWIPKYRRSELTGDVAVRLRDLLRQIAAEHELEIVCGKVARDHVHLFVVSTESVREPDGGVTERDQLASIAAGASGEITFGREGIWRSAPVRSSMR